MMPPCMRKPLLPCLKSAAKAKAAAACQKQAKRVHFEHVVVD